MKRKMLLLTLAAMLFGWCGVFAAPIIGDNDTLWTRYYNNVVSLKFHPSGNSVMVGQRYAGLFELDAQTGDKVMDWEHQFEPHIYNSYSNIDFNKSGTIMLTVEGNYRVLLWDYSTKQVIRGFIETARNAFFGNNDKRIYCFRDASDEATNLWIYDIESDSVIFRKKFNISVNDKLSALATSPDGRYFALASEYEDAYTHETKCNLAVFDAATFEKVVDVVKDEVGSIDEIEFSENSKWLAYVTGGYTTVVFNLEKLVNENIIERTVYIETMYPNFLKSDSFLLLGSFDTKRETFFIDLVDNTTFYYLNYQIFNISTNLNNNRFVCKRALSGDMYMFNSNWYYTNVEEPIIETIIHSLNYSETSLNYSFNIQNPINIKITNSAGTTLYTNSASIPSSGTIFLPLTSGVYFFIVNDGNRDYVKKFIVVN